MDHLPKEVDYINPFDPNYNSIDHTYTWNIGTLQEDYSGSVNLTVVVNNLAEPLGKFTNVCVIEANEIWPKTAIEITDVNCWNPGIIYVNIDAIAGNNTGMSWEHAYTDLQVALARARECGCDQIWVAEGTYKPTEGSSRSISFDLLDGVALYGGFPSGGGTLSERNPIAYETILSGDIGTPDYQNDNSYHVVEAVYINNAVLDGFIIKAGYANGSDADRCGGGIYNYNSQSLITNCTFIDNLAFYGGALYDYNSSDMNITNCVFKGNTSRYYGGGIYNYKSSPEVTNCIFSENQAEGYNATNYHGRGGGMTNNNQSSPRITNCTFSKNSADSAARNYTAFKLHNYMVNRENSHNKRKNEGISGITGSYKIITYL